MANYIIEHLEPELYEWCIIEYKNISKIVGKENLWITNIQEKEQNKLKDYAKVSTESITELNLEKACILDPESNTLLTPNNSKQFKYLIFGGILGDHPPKKRTFPELTSKLKFPSFNIGKDQFSTDNAVAVTKEINEGKNLKDLKFQSGLDIKINDILTTSLPYHYLIKNGKPFISQELIEYIRKKDSLQI